MQLLTIIGGTLLERNKRIDEDTIISVKCPL